MQLDRHGTIGRTYVFCYRLGRAFLCERNPADPFYADLCAVVRTIFIVAPLVIALNLATVAFATFAAGFLLYALWLNALTFGIVMLVVATIAGLLALFLFIVWGSELAGRWFARTEASAALAAYYDAKKRRICPLIEITEGGSSAHS